jgi:hypothetical protein
MDKPYKTKILPLVLYGCETSFLTVDGNTDCGCLRTRCEESGPKRKWQDVEKSHKFITCYCEQINDNEITCEILVGKTEGKRPLVRFRYTWEDNIRMDLREHGGKT